ncbi:MAG TPA: GGDEF domain-containing protein [Pseudolabrys sp.]|nr:GGDEF domain-containing protein [Pseudolabrys sp.]
MRLDVQTLSVVTVFVTALLGALLVFAGLQNRAVRAPMVWGAAFIVGAAGLGLITTQGAMPDWIAVNIANALVLLGTSLTWAGARIFDSRPVRPGLVLAPSVLWLIACTVPAFADDINLRVVLVSALMAMLAAVTAEEFWRGRAEPLMSRWPTVCALLAYAAALLARIPATLLSPLLQGQLLMGGVSFALLAFGTLLFTVVLAFLLLNMTKERSELQHKIASLIDPLSGVPNRRAFLDGANRLLAQQSLDPEPLAVLLFDLDRFKTINDRLGHGTGDAVLRIFAATGSRTLGADVVFGRIGGEEFAAVMPVGDMGEALAIADRVRRNFAGAAESYAADDLKPTVSVGVTLGCDPKVPVANLLAAADQALYRAKANGRNRVEGLVPAGVEEVRRPGALAGLAERRIWRKVALRA